MKILKTILWNEGLTSEKFNFGPKILIFIIKIFSVPDWVGHKLWSHFQNFMRKCSRDEDNLKSEMNNLSVLLHAIGHGMGIKKWISRHFAHASPGLQEEGICRRHKSAPWIPCSTSHQPRQEPASWYLWFSECVFWSCQRLFLEFLTPHVDHNPASWCLLPG